jgi:hypothetical protein
MIRAAAAWVLSAGVAVSQVPGPDEVALANARFELWHTVTVALADQHGRRTAPWTASVYALSRIADGDSALDIENLLLVAETWLVGDAEGVPAGPSAAAGIDAELARRVLCYVGGEGPGRAHRLIGRWGAPAGGADCSAVMAEDFDAADRTFRHYPPGDGDPVRTRYGADRWSRLAADHEVLEEMADTLSADFDWPRGLSLEIVPCGAVDARYVPAKATITLCAETIGHYHALADGRVGH